MGNDNSRPEPDAPSPAPNTVRAEIDVDHVQRLNVTHNYDVDEYVVTRRDTEFPVTLHSRNDLRVESGKIVHTSGNEIALEIGNQRNRRSVTTVYVTIPANAAIGVYTLTINGTFVEGDTFEVSLKRKVVVLFNAWSKNDGVYVDKDEWREEYVINSNGRLYAGSLVGMPWSLGLYRPDSLRAVMHLLEKVAKLTFDQKRNPIHVAREMSALVNIQDEGGVLVGRWDGVYDDGQPPTFWRGSGEILQQYYKSNGTPVRYGQCWVFSGVLLSVLRILGIPSRSVTNFSSAHDTNRNRTIDEYYNEDGEKVGYLSSGSDSIWNFHVWNEAYLARPDLPSGFGGWQVLDATPQEESPQGGGYRTGPASLKAIKDGNSLLYDANFVIAEVNADIKKFLLDERGVPRLFKVDTTSVGKNISTKAVGSTKREDLTEHYKYPEGSDWERRALYEGYDELLKEVYDMEFEIPATKYAFGEDVTITVNMTNKARRHQVKGQILCEAVTYTGRVLREMKKQHVDVKVNKGKTETVTMTIEGSIFSEYPGTKVYLRFDILLAVHGHAQVFNEKVNISPDPPQLEIHAPTHLGIGSEAEVIVKFKNPLPVEMENVTLNVESDELLHEDIIHNIGTIGPHAEFSYPFTITGMKIGMYDLIVGLESNKVELVTGEAEVEVVQNVLEEPDSAPTPMTVEVDSVDLNSEENRRTHHTDRYDNQGLIVRRGQVFSVTVVSKETLPANTTIVTNAVFQLNESSSRRPFMFEVDTVTRVAQGKNIKIELKTPADVPVGEYQMLLKLDIGGQVTVVQQNLTVTILFNPWCIEDKCHYPEASHLDEYVLNNQGRIWVGSYYDNYGRPWQFAQFKKDCLEVVLWLLDKMDQQDRADPVKVTRHISAVTNVQDDRGILVGNWSGDYSGGTSPLSWTGSADILTEFNQKKKPVSYAQCWVFSGVQTTLLRCLGLAARSITNFASAHDTNFNRAIDKFFDEDGEEISTGDSIWNFHVWNESYMARPDLPSGFGGWQVLDATPQEESPQGGLYRLGPSPRQAIKLGQRMNYDVEFVISEVNADVRYYTVNADESLTLTRVDTASVGKNMSTKAIGSDAREDVTLDYKFAEGSTSERAGLLASTESESKIGITLSVDDNIMIGQDFFVRSTVTNKTGNTQDFKIRLYGRAMLYTGAPGQSVKSHEETATLTAGQTKQVELHIVATDYLRILEGGNYINFVAMAAVPEEKLSVVRTETFRFKTPSIVITLPPGGLKLHQAAIIRVEFKNPLGKKLTNGKFFLHGEGYIQDTTTNVDPVGPHGTVAADLMTIPVKKGSFDLVIRFTSDQLTDILDDQNTQVT